MKQQYDQEMLTIIEQLEMPKKLLLHSCCAPCSSYVISELSSHFYITILYYNPNIYPEEEYEKRKQEQIRFIQEYPAKYPITFLDCDYDQERYERCIEGLEQEPERGQRCWKCYRLRLEKTAQLAANQHYDFFATTLTLSPYKNAEVINQIGVELEGQYQIRYLPSDFKKRDGYKKSIILSEQYHLYRQNYCGCKYARRKPNDEKTE